MRDALADEQGSEWLAVERAIWPDGPAHGHGSGEYAAFKARTTATIRDLVAAALLAKGDRDGG